MTIDDLKVKLYTELLKLSPESFSDLDIELQFLLSKDPFIQKVLDQALISERISKKCQKEK